MTGIVLIAGTAGYLYLFRSETVDNPALGLITHHYSWGRPSVVEADVNRDGSTDYRGIQAAEFGPPSSHTPILEFWEDTDFDGAFDHHGVHENGVLETVELDEDGDGRFERVLTGQDARDYYTRRAEENRQ